MRRTRRRRSTSSWVSPGPRVPMRPACWLSATPRPRSRGQPVAQQRELDLRLALGAARVLGEDVEDHRGAVDRRAAEQPLEVALLGGGERLVEHDGVGVDGEAQLVQLGDLALAEVGGGVRRVAALHEPREHVGARGVDEQGELVEPGLDVVGVVPGEDDADEHDALADGALDERASG